MPCGERILVRAPNWLGDAVMAIPALHALREAFPRAHIAIDARSGIAPLFDSVAGIDAVHVCPSEGGLRNLAAKRAHANMLRATGFDTGLLFTNSLSTAILLRLEVPGRRIGMSSLARRLLLSDAVPLTPALSAAHQTAWYGAVTERAGARPASGLPDIRPSDRSLAEADAALAPLGLHDAPFAVLAPGSAYGPAKDWLPERFAELAQCFLLDGIRVVLTGSAKDAAQAEAIAASAGMGAVSLAGATGLPGFLGVLARACCFVGNDSGAAHCAAAIGLPTVAVFGSTRPGRTRPMGKRVACVTGTAPCAPCMRRVCNRQPAMACMHSVTVEQVWHTLEELNVFGAGQRADVGVFPPEGENHHADCACLDR